MELFLSFLICLVDRWGAWDVWDLSLVGHAQYPLEIDATY